MKRIIHLAVALIGVLMFAAAAARVWAVTFGAQDIITISDPAQTQYYEFLRDIKGGQE